MINNISDIDIINKHLEHIYNLFWLPHPHKTLAKAIYI